MKLQFRRFQQNSYSHYNLTNEILKNNNLNPWGVTLPLVMAMSTSMQLPIVPSNKVTKTCTSGDLIVGIHYATWEICSYMLYTCTTGYHKLIWVYHTLPQLINSYLHTVFKLGVNIVVTVTWCYTYLHICSLWSQPAKMILSNWFCISCKCTPATIRWHMWAVQAIAITSEPWASLSSLWN